MIQIQNNFNQSLYRAKVKISQLLNTMNDRNEKILPKKLLTILDFPNHIDMTQELWCLEILLIT